MSLVANLVIGLLALMHVWFLVLEMFLWTRPSGLQAFHMTRAFAQQTKA
jgi:putative membrane protein